MRQSGRVWPARGPILKREKLRRIGETYYKTVSQRRAATDWSCVASDYAAGEAMRAPAEETLGACSATRTIPPIILTKKYGFVIA